MLNRIIQISLIFAFSQPVFSHTGHAHDSNSTITGQVFGTVIDSSNSAPIEYVSISIKDAETGSIVTGALTDNTGRFTIKNIPIGHYEAVVEFIGYESKSIEGIALVPNEEKTGLDKDLGIIQLSVTAVNLDAVEVVGDDSQFIQKIDKQVFNVGKNLVVSGGTGTDVLRKVPTVDVDIDGQVSIAGDANVTVLIDGKKSGLSGTTRRGNVENISASMIDRVEVITNPSAKYDPDGVGGIINIILKRGTNDGLNGSISALAGQYNKKNFNGSVNYRTKKWNGFVNGNYSAGDRIGDGLRQFQYQYSDYTDSLFQKTTRTMSPTNMSVRVGGDYYPSKSKSFGYTLTVADHKDDTENNIDYVVNTIDPTNIGNVNFINHDYGFHLDNTIYFENNFDSDDKHLKILADLSYELDDVNEHGQTTDDNNFISTETETNAKEENNGNMVSLDFKNRFNEQIGYEIGGKAYLKTYQTDLDYLKNNFQSLYSEDIYAIYATGDYELTDRFSVKAGARFEQVHTNASVKKLDSPDALDSSNVILKIFNLAIEQSPYDNPYSSLYPSAFLLYKLTEKQTLQFGYSKKVNRPRRRSLSPFPRNTSDVTRIRNGNPYLDPEYSDVLEIKFSSNSRKVNFNSGVSYKLTKDAIMWWDRDVVEFEGDTYEILTADNSENSKSINGNMTFFYRPVPMTSIMLSGWAWNTTTYGNGESDLNGDTRGYHLRSQFTLTVPKIARFEFSVGGRGKMKITSGTIPASFRADLGVQKSFIQNKLSVTLKLNDVFDSGKFKINTENLITNPITNETYNQLMYGERKRDRRSLSVVFNYNFGRQQKKKWDRSQYQRNGGGGMEMDY